MKKFATGAIPSPPDPRDYRIAAAALAGLPTKHMQEMPPVIDQGSVGNCVGQACCYAAYGTNGIPFDPNFIYGRRNPDDHQGYGWHIRRALETMLKEGCVPYKGQEPLEVPDVINYVNKNLSTLLEQARLYKIEAYAKLTTAQEIKAALVNGMKVIFAAPITSWHPYLDGLFRCTINNCGFHAMSVWGYDGDRFRVQNSWGAKWGDGGRCWMLAEDILRIGDCWAITDKPNVIIVNPFIGGKEVRIEAKIKTKAPGAKVYVRKTSDPNSEIIAKIPDGSTVLVLSEHGTRREVCYSKGKGLYFVGWVPSSYIQPLA